jgi:hypothetical protein
MQHFSEQPPTTHNEENAINDKNVPQIEIPFECFEGTFFLRFAEEIRWHDFSDEPFFIVDLEGPSTRQPPYYDVVVILVVVAAGGVLVLLAILLSLVADIVLRFRFTSLQHQMDFHRKS